MAHIPVPLSAKQQTTIFKAMVEIGELERRLENAKEHVNGLCVMAADEGYLIAKKDDGSYELFRKVADEE